MMFPELSKQDKRYTKTLATLNTQICQQVHDTTWQPEQAGGVAASHYDIISGAAGVFAYLVTLEGPMDEVLEAIHILVQYLIWLAESDPQETRESWYIPPELLEPDFERPRYPNGNLNCGLAHGIPGPLAALAIAWNAGYRFPGMREAIVSLSHWVLRHQISDEWGINWPSAVPFSVPEATNEPEGLPARAAWCYGAPGIARSLWLAGLLQICLRFAHETGNETLRRHIPVLVTQILDLFDPDFALGFRDLDADGVGIDSDGKPATTPVENYSSHRSTVTQH